jgi:hypothetical protein
MKRVLWGLLLSIAATALTCHAQTTADETAVRNVPQRFAQAWEKHDGRELAKIMAEDVDFVNVGADWLQGRADFETYHTRLLSGSCNLILPCSIGVGQSKGTRTRTELRGNRGTDSSQ